MKQFIVTIVRYAEDGEILRTQAYGPFASEARANGFMQEFYEGELSDSDLFTDDTDAAHFTIVKEDDTAMDFLLVELERPEDS